MRNEAGETAKRLILRVMSEDISTPFGKTSLIFLSQSVHQMMLVEGASPDRQTVERVCEIFASTIRSFKHPETA